MFFGVEDGGNENEAALWCGLIVVLMYCVQAFASRSPNQNFREKGMGVWGKGEKASFLKEVFPLPPHTPIFSPIP